MKISVTHCDEKVTIETKQDDLTLSEFMDYIKRITRVMYSESQIENYWK